MTDAIGHRGPDGVHQVVAGPLGMAHCLLRTLPTARENPQPLWNETGDLCITLDGRIDNRDELRLGLGVDGRRIRDDTDAELLLHSYQRWGVECIARVVGDFALALWDGPRQELVCARDFLGKRPLYYYYCGGSSFRWASEPQAVLTDPSVPRRPNEGMIAEYLSIQVSSRTDTLFRDLFRLAPAHVLVVSRGGLKLSRYWSWERDREIVYRDERDYADHLLTVCSDAARARLQTRWPVALELSGGVDSSSLVGIIENLRQRGCHGAHVETYSLVFPGRACDETAHIRAVSRHCRVRNHEIEPRPAPASAYQDQARQYLDLPDYPNTMMHRPLWSAATEQACRVVLTGSGPDEWLAGSLYSYACDLRALQLRRLGAAVQSDAKAGGRRHAAGQFWRYGLKPLAPARLREVVRRVRRRSLCPPWLRSSFFQSSGLVERIRDAPLLGNPSAKWLTDGWRTHATESAERALASSGLQGRDPFDDRRVVEFALALPENQRRRGPISKYVLREAVVGWIPESVRMRRDKADYSDVFCEHLRLHGGARLFQSMALEDLGWVDGARVRSMYQSLERGYRAGKGPASDEHMWQLWLVSSVERWLQVL